MKYEDYLRSQHWKRVRQAYRKSDRPQACEICGATPYELHHKTYERLGHERLTDLVALCQRCHSILHQLQREGQTDLDPRSLFSKARAEAYRQDRKEPEPFTRTSTLQKVGRKRTNKPRKVKTKTWNRALGAENDELHRRQQETKAKLEARKAA